MSARWAAAVLFGALPVALLATSGCKSFSCEELANCPRTSGSGGTTAGSGGSGDGGNGEGGGNDSTCSQPSDCANDLCVDGYCCDSACDDLCESCAVAGVEGTCSPAIAASNDDNECGNGVCDGSGECAEGAHLASTSYGRPDGSERPNAMAVNDAGRIAVAGTYTGTAHFGGSFWTSESASDFSAFMGSYDAMLAHSASHGYRDEFNPNGQSGRAAAIDPSGYVVTAGTFEGQAYFLGGGTLTQSSGLYNMYITRVDPLGNVDWARAYGSDPGYQTPRGLAVNNAGEIFVAGYFEDSINFNSPQGQLDASGFLMDVFVAKINTNGTGAWAMRFGDSADQRAHNIALDPNDNVLLVGEYQGTINFGGDTFLDDDGRAGFLVKLDPNGNHLWSHSYTGPDDQEPLVVTSDRDGNVLFAGEVENNIDLGGGVLPGPGYDVFVAKLDPDGNHLWSHRFGGNYQDSITGIATDSRGNVILTGEFYNNFACGGDTLLAQGTQYDIFVCKLSKDGIHLWSRRYGDDTPQRSAGVGVDGLDNIYLGGYFEGPFDLGGGPLVYAGSGDMFLAQLSP